MQTLYFNVKSLKWKAQDAGASFPLSFHLVRLAMLQTGNR